MPRSAHIFPVLIMLTACPGCTTGAPCVPSATHEEGRPCGPCGMDGLMCSMGEWVCDGATECGLGEACTSDADCPVGSCAGGYCAPDGMAVVRAGAFLMGAPAAERGWVDNEDRHLVLLTRHYFMDTHEVTQGEFEAVMGFNPSYFSNCGPDCPVESARWVEALAYANARSVAEFLPPCYDLSACRRAPGARYTCPVPLTVDLDCIGYRLPTEAEWEYAYRAGTTSAYYSGDANSPLACDQPALDEIAQYCGNCSVTYGQTIDCTEDGVRPEAPTDCGTTTVGSFAPNPWGLFDMSGNVAELVWDTPGDYPGYAEDPMGPGPEEQTGYAVQRGAGFCGHMARLRAADRKITRWISSSPAIGFRLVRTYRRAAPEERLGQELCDNGCGGCKPLTPAPGTACGRCGAGRWVCDAEAEGGVRCEGDVEGCDFGAECAPDGSCAVGVCSNGHCVPNDDFAYIPPGHFTMGSPLNERGREEDEVQHEVVLERPFLMQRREVTQRQWHALMGTTPAHFSECGPDCPVERMSRFDAMAYSNALSRSQGLPECYHLSECVGLLGDSFECPSGITFDIECEGYRLPTEAEWEYAYRAGATSAFYTGDVPNAVGCDQPLIDEIAQFCGNCAREYAGTFDCEGEIGFPNCGPAPVAQLAPNAYGLFDMSGNVAELVWDLYGDYPTFARNPTGPVDVGQDGIARGGGFCGHMARVRGAEREALNPAGRRLDVGFRLARTLPSTGESVCENECGGCRPLYPEPGELCGPCRLNRIVCDRPESTRCDGADSDCAFGNACTTNADCRSSVCVRGWCTLPGFAYVPPGGFDMGSPPGEPFRRPDETRHPVTLTQGFLMMEREVTQGDFEHLLGVNPSRFASCGADCPVEGISWLDALAFANALSRESGLEECYDLSSCTGTPGARLRCNFDVGFSLACDGFRLPTEAEWEYAYRAGTSGTYYTGTPSSTQNCDQPLLDGHAQFCGNCSVSYAEPFDCSGTGGFVNCGTTSVGSHAPNPWGLYDMNGNVAELVWDVIAPYPASATDPTGPTHAGQDNIARGGGFCAHYARLRAADRRTLTRIATIDDVGVRLVRSARP